MAVLIAGEHCEGGVRRATDRWAPPMPAEIYSAAGDVGRFCGRMPPLICMLESALNGCIEQVRAIRRNIRQIPRKRRLEVVRQLEAAFEAAFQLEATASEFIRAASQRLPGPALKKQVVISAPNSPDRVRLREIWQQLSAKGPPLRRGRSTGRPHIGSGWSLNARGAAQALTDHLEGTLVRLDWAANLREEVVGVPVDGARKHVFQVVRVSRREAARVPAMLEEKRWGCCLIGSRQFAEQHT